MKKVKTNKLGGRILSFVLTVALMVGLMPGNTLTAYAKADGIMYTPKMGYDGTDIYMEGYDTYIVDGTNPGTTAVYYYDNNGNQVYVNPNGAAGDDLSEDKIYSNGETQEALSGDVNIEMTGGSVGSIAIGFYTYGKGKDRTNVNVNISGGSCGCVEKVAHYGKSWVFSEQIVPMDQELTGYVTKTDSGWVAHGDAIIPEGKTVTVGEGEVFRIESGATLTNNGTIVNNGTINTYAPLNGTVTGNGTVVRNAICINDTGSSITVYKDGEEYPAQTEVADGKTYIYVPAGEIKVVIDEEAYYAKYSAEAGEFEPESEPKGVTDFTNMPTEIKANEPFTLSAGMVDEWLNTTVTYEISVDGGTDAVLDGNVLTAYGAGTIQVTVTAKDTYDYTFSKTYEIVVAYTPVSDIETVSSRIPVGINYDLSTYAVTNNDASYKTIKWSVVNANETGATITDNAIKATSAGTAVIRATVRNGQAYGEDYHKNYTIEFYETDEISVANGSITISKKDENTVTITGGGLAEAKEYPIDESIRIIGSTTNNTITVKSGATANVILNGVEIDCSNTGITPIMVESGATLNLTLIGDNVLTACTLDNGTNEQKTAALGVPVGAELVIMENSTGTLTANGAKGGGAGIGGAYNSGAGTITINGGTVNATSDNGAGIGGGYNKRNDEVTINGGTVTINGGSVDATSTNGAGIGGGYYGFGGTVIIKGGTVNATSICGAGIGGGRYSQNPNNYITVTIEGGTVNATSSEGAGIGGSDKYFSVTVTINGGTINAASTYGAGIGNGHYSGYGNLTVTITGGNFNYSPVTAPTNGTSTVACYTSKFLSDSVDMAGKAVTAIALENGGTYGLKDVVTFDGGSENEGYFNCYLPAGSKITSITVGGTTYNCRAEDGTCYVEHTWEDATCTIAEHCIVCDKTRGEISSHNYVNGVCTICGMDSYGTFHIKTAEQLVAFAQSVNAGNKDANAVLDADIDMTGVDWTPICQTVSYHSSEATDTGYSGTFDGNGHTISNLTVTGKLGGTYSYGLFGTVSGTVENLGMVNYTYTMGSAPDARAGSIAGQVLTGGTITNCYSVGHTVKTNDKIAGGIVGCNYGGTISNCYAISSSIDESITGHGDRWGGVVGDCQKDDGTSGGTVSNCYTNDTRVVSSQNNSANITNCAVKDDAAFASGEITYLLNGSSSGNVTWYQTLETDTYPVLDSEHGTVYSVFKCDGTTPAGYSNVNKNKGHIDADNNGICDVCNEVLIRSTIKEVSATLSGDIGLNYYVELSEIVTADDGAYVQFTVNENITTVPVSSITPENGIYKFTIWLTAKEMRDDVTFGLYDGNGTLVDIYSNSGSQIEGSTFDYTLETYFNTLSAENNTELKELADATLLYGLCAELAFNPDADSNVDVSELADVTTETLEENKITKSAELPEGLKLTEMTLILKTETALRLYFKADDISDYTFKLNGTKATVNEIAEEGLYYIEIPNISAKDLDTMYTLIINDSCTLKFNALSYAYAVVKADNNANLSNVVKALYKYNEAANAYFEN